MINMDDALRSAIRESLPRASVCLSYASFTEYLDGQYRQAVQDLMRVENIGKNRHKQSDILSRLTLRNVAFSCTDMWRQQMESGFWKDVAELDQLDRFYVRLLHSYLSLDGDERPEDILGRYEADTDGESWERDYPALADAGIFPPQLPPGWEKEALSYPQDLPMRIYEQELLMMRLRYRTADSQSSHDDEEIIRMYVEGKLTNASLFRLKKRK